MNKQTFSLIYRLVQISIAAALLAIFCVINKLDTYDSPWLWHILMSGFTISYVSLTLGPCVPPLVIVILEICYLVNWGVLVGFTWIPFMPQYCEEPSKVCHLGLSTLVLVTILAFSFVVSLSMVSVFVIRKMDIYHQQELRSFKGYKKMVVGSMFLKDTPITEESDSDHKSNLW
ncbi:hypothetical protein CLIB1444_03S09076 [[Candida] jaroonii]|uniref:Uncharacterized protein n=1 Tax=[Candida] jaroonii TaxID=467808 RepID=A0ACA9Y5T7_9ASCO|nr:hypothetical protein CLIB1444_03S09076 [[Candida] jaroonii]